MKRRFRRPVDVRGQHAAWLDLVEVTGPFLSVPVLRRAFPAGLSLIDKSARERLRAEHADFFDTPAAQRDSSRWIQYVLRDLLEWEDSLRYGEAVPTELAAEVSEHEERITPTFALAAKDGTFPILGLVSAGTPTGRVAGSSWAATPADRMAYLLRRHGIPLGLVTDGRWWVLVWAPLGGVTTQAVFDASLWREESELARAFYSLLCYARFFSVPDEETLPALLKASQDNQEEITEALGVQVRRAVELLVDAIGRAEEPVRRARDLEPLGAHEAYAGAVAVMMRLVFLLFAEDRGLLPVDDEVYQAHYSASRLVDELEARANAEGEEALEHTELAWHRLLALFRAVHGGVSAGTLRLPPYDGSLFDPDARPWLEGRFTKDDGPDTQALRIDDRTVLHMLRAVQYVEIGSGQGRERRRLTFATLDVEQIGYVYEGLLGFDGYRAADVVVGLTGKAGKEEEIPLPVLEEHATAARGDVAELARRLSEAYDKKSGLGKPAALAKKLAPLHEDEARAAESKLLAATDGDIDLARRLLPYYRIIRQDLRDLPIVIRPGALYVTESPLRGNTGTHYTPRFLAEQVVEGALEPLVYAPGPLQTADRAAWRLRSSDEILALKVADIAMGSAAFLVAACRYLADRLMEAWTAEGDERAVRLARTSSPDDVVFDRDADPALVEARRLVIERCLYGVDINPMAVEMAKLSLWLVSMDPEKPFTFVDDKVACGDSLLGITSMEQLEWMHINSSRGRKLHEGKEERWTLGAERLAAEVAELRRKIAATSDYDGKRELLEAARHAVERAEVFADLVSGAALAGARSRERKTDDLSLVAADLVRLVEKDPARLSDAERQAVDWLRTDLPRAAFARDPLHWPLVFPEVFAERGGFDAVIGNPPFLGGKKISGTAGSAYREYLVETVGHGVKGNADLVAYFELRAHELLNESGQTGLIATNTLAQGDTREVALDQIAASGVEIRRAVKSEKWPSRSAVLEYCAVWTTAASMAESAQRVLDGQVVRRITPALDPESRVSGKPERLACNSGISFQGSIVVGLGFVMPPEEARDLLSKDPRNSDVLFPYLNGEDLNSRSDCSASRWIINFHDWSVDRAKEYSDCFDRVHRLVKPERDKVRRDAHRERWWRYGDLKPSLYRAIAGLDQVIVITLVSKVVMPVMVPTGQVFSHMLGVFATDDMAMLGLLSSAPHYWWAISRASTMKGDLRYTPSDVFETFARPEPSQEMRELGERLHAFRGELMRSRNLGLTKTYNLVHDPGCVEEGIAELREIHRRIDQAVCRAYGWDDLELDHGFHETRQGVRYTVGPAVRQEILDRLLELNHQRYAEEVERGLHGKKGKKAAAQEGLF